MNVDPMAEMYPAWTPYNYVANNPLQIIDINGECWYQGAAAQGRHGMVWDPSCEDKSGYTQVTQQGEEYTTNSGYYHERSGSSSS